MIALDKSKITIAISNKGRLNAPAVELLQKSGYSFRAKERQLYATASNGDLQIIFLRTEDIPVLVASGAVDMGVTGSDLVLERGAAVTELMPLDFGKCRLCVAVKDDYAGSVAGLKGKRIATSFPRIASDYFARMDADVDCIEMNGALEIMVGLELADAIVDIVETGDTLRENNLKVLAEIGSYETKLIAHPDKTDDARVKQIARRIEGVILARKYSLLEYNVRRDRFKEAEAITPGFDSPTVSALDDADFVAVQAMVLKKDVVTVMDKLEAIGATAIIETEIKNCRL